MKEKSLGAYVAGLTLAGGDRDGETFTVLPWERRFLRGAFRPGVSSAGLSVARGNGKSALVAGIACAVVDPDGPLHGRRREVVVVASSFAQARIVFEDVVVMLRDRLGSLPRGEWRLQDSVAVATLDHRASGARVRCIGSDPRRAHGLRPVLVLADEPAQWPPATGERMIVALRTGLGKVPHSRLVALGTRPAAAEHWFAKMLDGGADFSQCHAARPDDPPFRARTWARANPSARHLPSLAAQLRREARDARRDPSALAGFRALRLNLGVGDVQERGILDPGVWAEIEVGKVEPKGRYALGLDLGSSAAMSAAAAYWPESGSLGSFAVFPALPSLEERGLRDGVGRLYLDMAKRGELLQRGGRVSDLRGLLREVLDRWGAPGVIATDRWREAELREALETVRFPRASLIVRGMGYRDGGEDVREFRRACLDGRCRPVRSLLMRSAMAEARVSVDPAGNEKLAKGKEGWRRANARDDACAAAILAVASGVRMAAAVARPGGHLRYAVV